MGKVTHHRQPRHRGLVLLCPASRAREGGGLASGLSLSPPLRGMSSQNTVSYASGAHSWLRKQPSSLCLIIFVHRIWCVFVGCVRVISQPGPARPLQAPEITNSRTVAPPGWMTVCGYDTSGHAANHDHVASSRRVQPVHSAAGTCTAASTQPC